MNPSELFPFAVPGPVPLTNAMLTLDPKARHRRRLTWQKAVTRQLDELLPLTYPLSANDRLVWADSTRKERIDHATQEAETFDVILFKEPVDITVQLVRTNRASLPDIDSTTLAVKWAIDAIVKRGFLLDDTCDDINSITFLAHAIDKGAKPALRMCIEDKADTLAVP